MENMKRLGVFLVLFGGLILHAQPTSFYKVFSGIGYDKGEGIVQLEDDSYTVVGSSSSFQDAPSQGFLLHLDPDGNYLWSKDFGGSEIEEGKRVLYLSSYGYFITGTSNSGSSHNYDFWIVSTDMNGTVLWENTYDLGNWERVNDAILLQDTSIIVVGETNNTSDESLDMVIMRIAKDGTMMYQMQYGVPNQSDRLTTVASISDTSFVVSGSMYDQDSLMNKAYFAAFHIDGTSLWETLGGAEGMYTINDLLLDVDGKLRAFGERQKVGMTNYNMANFGLTLDGTLVHEYTENDVNTSRGTAFAQYDVLNSKKFFVGCGIINPNNPTYPEGEDLIIFRYSNGMYWDGYGMGYSSQKQDQCNEIVHTNDDFAVAVGFHTNYGSGGCSVFVVKIGDDAAFPYESGIPPIYDMVGLTTDFKELGITMYPNPSNGFVHFNGLKEGEQLRIINQQGQIVLEHEISNTELPTLDITSLENGCYIVQFITGKGIAQTKLTKMN